MRRFLPILLVVILTNVVSANTGDATIRAIHFADGKEGWATGDEGVIWHTIDSGKTWERQESGTKGSIRGVQFLNPYTGFAVARLELPNQKTMGLVLGTTDGGLTWKTLSTGALPGLNGLKFFDEKNGFVYGDGSDGQPTGVFRTVDGGINWKVVAGTRSPTWYGGDFSDPETGVLVGAWGRIAPYQNSRFAAADVDSLGGRTLRQVKLVGERAYAVGSGALVLVSPDSSGVRWGLPDLKLSKELRAEIDFNALAVHGKHVWVTGRPGSVVFHSADEGKSWEIQYTNQNTPLHAIHFVDEKNGWAAGDYGTILRTEDGGKTWQVARLGGLRSAILFVHARAKGVPFDVVASLGGGEGYLTTSLAVIAEDAPALGKKGQSEPERLAIANRSANPLSATNEQRLGFALRSCGGAIGEQLWQFPVTNYQEGIPPDELLASWEGRHGEKASVALIRQLVLAIRLWRPDIVITDGNSDGVAEAITLAAVKEAFKLAAEEETFPEQITALKLRPWASRKLYSLSPKADPALVRISTVESLVRWGDTASDLSDGARKIWDLPPCPFTRSFRLMATRISAEGDSSLFDGIPTLTPGGAARRDPLPITREEQINRKKWSDKRRSLESLAKGNLGELVQPEQALSRLLSETKDMPSYLAARTLQSIAEHHAQEGQWLLAKEIYSIVVTRYPNTAAAVEAYRWLVRYQTSGEARRRMETKQFIEVSISGPKELLLEDKMPTKAEIIQATHRETMDPATEGRRWLREALALENSLLKYGAIFGNDPASQLCLAAAKRQLGLADANQKWLQKYLAETAVPTGGQAQVPGSDPWRECALMESWLMNRSGRTAPKPALQCKKVESRPHLDGKLNEAIWKTASASLLSNISVENLEGYGSKEAIDELIQAQLASSGEKLSPSDIQNLRDQGTRTMFCYDDEFLYIAVVCRHPKGKKQEVLTKRQRDMNLSQYDRIEIMLDVDRDYQTYYRFCVDQRGALAEDCWGDKTWNPKWYVAVNAEAEGWSAEIAIPLKELTGETISPGKLWAMNVVRIIPNVGIQAWSGPAGLKPRPEGMGLLSFSEASK